MEFDVVVQKLGTSKDLREANDFTSGGNSVMGLETAYNLSHSVVRTQLFKVKMYGIPTKCSVHLVRHSAVGQLHYVKTNREDRGTLAPETDIHRLTPVNHMMYLNAEHLIDMARKRLCNTSDNHTVKLMQAIQEEVRTVDPALARHMMPNCIFRGGQCFEGKNSCGLCPTI